MSKLNESMWLRRVSQLGLAGALMMPLLLDGAETAEQAKNNIKDVYARQNSSLQELFKQIEAKRRAAIIKASDGDYANALKELEALQKQLGSMQGDFAKSKSAEISGNTRRIKRVYSGEIMKKAQEFAAAKKYDQAVTEAQKAQVLMPDDKTIFNFLFECQKNLAAKKFSNEVDMEKLSPNYQQKRKEVDMNLREAKLLVRKNQLEAAIPKLERVLLVDPFNMEAVQVLTRIYSKLYRIGIDRGEEMILATNARNAWEWSEPLTRVALAPNAVGTNQQGKTRKSGESDLYNTLESIIVENVPYAQSNVNNIIRFLNDQVKEKGIAIIASNLSPEEGMRPVSLDLGRTPLLDVIRYFSMASGLSYQFRGDQVVFGRVDNMSTEHFPVRGDIIAFIIDQNTVRAKSSTMKDIESSGGDGAPPEDLDAPVIDDGGAAADAISTVSSGNKRAIVDANALKKYFEQRWIEFKEGAHINYNRRTERLSVHNTPENLRRMEALLRQLDALEQPMIMVEVKMVELTNTNLNELGFEWAFSASRTDGNTWTLGTTDPTRHGSDAGEKFNVVKNLKIFPNFGEKLFGSDTKVDLSLSINAVAQNRQAEVLASPKILSENNPKNPAMIKMVENTYFITEWEQPDMESEGFNIKLEGDQPDWDDEARQLGVTFTVKPSVNVDNYTITLNDIKPVFYTHVRDYDNYLTYGIYQQVGNNERQPIAERVFNLKMPEFSKREITTNITLYDGETVLIGGMVDNEVKTRKDKWPLIGDIPFIGNFFGDQQHDIFNRTLLIFITARLMNSKGSPWNADNSMKNRGLVDFSR